MVRIIYDLINKDHIVVVNFSGGKDSTCTLLKVLEMKIPIHRIVYMRIAGNTYPKIEDYLKGILKIIDKYYPETLKLFEIIECKAKCRMHNCFEDFWEYALRHAGFPVPHVGLWCLTHFKLEGYHRWIKEKLKLEYHKVISVVGIKKGDSHWRKKWLSEHSELIPPNTTDVRITKTWKWFPIMNMTNEELWSYLKENYPEVYEYLWSENYGKGISLSQCLLCPYRSKGEVQALARLGFRDWMLEKIDMLLQNEKGYRLSKQILLRIKRWILETSHEITNWIEM